MCWLAQSKRGGHSSWMASSHLTLSLTDLMHQFHKCSHLKESALMPASLFPCCELNRMYVHASLLEAKEMWHVTQQQHVSCPVITPSKDKTTAEKIIPTFLAFCLFVFLFPCFNSLPPYQILVLDTLKYLPHTMIYLHVCIHLLFYFTLRRHTSVFFLLVHVVQFIFIPQIVHEHVWVKCPSNWDVWASLSDTGNLRCVQQQEVKISVWVFLEL